MVRMADLRRFGAALAAAVVLAACSDGGDGVVDEADGGTTEPPAAVPVPTLVLADVVAFDEPVTITAEDGTVQSATVLGEADGTPLDGSVQDAEWVSSASPLPGLAYGVSVEVADAAGATHTLTGSFTVAEVPDERRLTLNVVRGGGEVVGVGTPIIVQFSQPVTERAAVEAALQVASEPQVPGAWHWLNSQEVHFRPKEYWPAGTRIRAHFALNGVRAGDDLWGGRSYTYDIEVGAAQIARVDASRHTFSLIRDGETVATWDTSLGKPDFATRNGTYIVLFKEPERNMTSCNANITCDPNDPAYYDVDTEFAVRLTNSGTFVHSAPWSETAQGEDNVSHGCINLNAANAETYYDLVRYGDVVEVVNSSREAADLVQSGDPGMVDWNLTWEQLLAGSERGEFTTDSL
jgi:lipoprotein-anchoring transpeptidase ErfK/SrfK